MKLSNIIFLWGFLSGNWLYAQDFEGKTNQIYLDLEPDPPELYWAGIIEETDTLNYGVMYLEFGVNSETELSKVIIYHNDQPTGKEKLRGVQGNHNFDHKFEQNLVLNEGVNKIGVAIVNSAGKRFFEEKTVYVKMDQGLITTSTRRDYALIIGINNYEGQSWGNLSNPIYDATTIAEELEEHYGFNVNLLEDATQDEIILKIQEMAKVKYGPDDQIFVFFAGHGYFYESLNQGYLVTKDSKSVDKDPTLRSYLSHANLRSMVDNIPCNHILLTVDACFGGTFDPKLAIASSRGSEFAKYEMSTLEFIKRKLKNNTRKYITSGGKEYVPDGRPGSHSPFAFQFIEALRSYGNHDKVLTFTELLTYLEKLPTQPRSGNFGVRNEPGSDFLFIAK